MVEFEDNLGIPSCVVKCHVKTFNQLRIVAEALQRDKQWVYRGQRDSGWSLTSSLERAKNDDKDGDIDIDCEVDAIKHFMHLTRGMLDYDVSYIDYLCAMQHYGVPTRLLDFTRSFLVALYFAFEDRINDGDNRAVWAVNMDKILENSSEIDNKLDKIAEGVAAGEDHDPRCYNAVFNGIKSNLHYDDAELVRLTRECANELLTLRSLQAELGILPVDLPRNNKRLIAQDGLFLMPQRQDSFSRNLAESLRIGSVEESLSDISIEGLVDCCGRSGTLGLVKVEIEESMRDEVRSFLRFANYTPNRIYPDVAGITRYVRYRSEEDEL